MRRVTRACALAASVIVAACGPRADIPLRAEVIDGQLAPDDSGRTLAQSLAPTLYLQRDETFTLERIVAVLHPSERIIAYHLLWRDDAHGAWYVFEHPTDHEIIWVGYDSTHAPTDIWTYWHGIILHADWRGRGDAAADVQWGKHGMMPRAMRLTDLPWSHSLDIYYMLAWLGLPDMWLGNIKRPGPWCFCHGYERYASFTEPLALAGRITAIVRTIDPHPALRAVFGERYAHKPHWPPTLPVAPRL